MEIWNLLLKNYWEFQDGLCRISRWNYARGPSKCRVLWGCTNHMSTKLALTGHNLQFLCLIICFSLFLLIANFFGKNVSFLPKKIHSETVKVYLSQISFLTIYPCPISARPCERQFLGILFLGITLSKSLTLTKTWTLSYTSSDYTIHLSFHISNKTIILPNCPRNSVVKKEKNSWHTVDSHYLFMNQ